MKAEHAAEKLKGFGSSDAQLIISYANTEKLSNSLHRRIGEIKGQVDRTSFTSMYTDLGNTVEDDMYKYIVDEIDSKALSNPKHYLSSDISNFTISNHIDYVLPSQQLWIELKSVKTKESEEIDFVASVFHKYSGQLAWHFMIMSQSPDYQLILRVYDTSDCYLDHSKYEFDPFNYRDLTITHDMVMSTIYLIEKGLMMLDEYWDTYDPYAEKEVVVIEDAEYQQVQAYQEINNILVQQKALQENLKKLKEKFLVTFEERGIKSIKTPDFTITYKNASSRSSVDTKKLKLNIGADLDKFMRVTQIKSSISISLNKSLNDKLY